MSGLGRGTNQGVSSRCDRQAVTRGDGIPVGVIVCHVDDDDLLNENLSGIRDSKSRSSDCVHRGSARRKKGQRTEEDPPMASRRSVKSSRPASGEGGGGG